MHVSPHSKNLQSLPCSVLRTTRLSEDHGNKSCLLRVPLMRSREAVIKAASRPCVAGKDVNSPDVIRGGPFESADQFYFEDSFVDCVLALTVSIFRYFSMHLLFLF